MRPKNFIKNVNQVMDKRLSFHNKQLKALIVKFECIRKESHTGIKMSMPKIDTLNGDGIFENLNGAGRLVFEYEINRQVSTEVWIKTRKLRNLIKTDIIIQAYEGTDLIRTFKAVDIDRRGETKTVQMWQPSTQTTEPVTSVRVTKFREHRTVKELVDYIRGEM